LVPSAAVAESVTRHRPNQKSKSSGANAMPTACPHADTAGNGTAATVHLANAPLAGKATTRLVGVGEAHAVSRTSGGGRAIFGTFVRYVGTTAWPPSFGDGCAGCGALTRTPSP